MMNLHKTLQRLADQFVARDIMTPATELVTGGSEDEARDRLTEYPEYDVIPIVGKGAPRAFLERGKARARTIQIQHLIGEGTPILNVVGCMVDRRFLFVVGCHEVVGMIHFSDLNDPVVKLPFFMLLDGVERRLSDALRGHVDEAVLPEIIRDERRVDALRRKMVGLRKEGADRDWVSLMYFREILEAAVHLEKVELTTNQIERLSTIRNRIDHASGDELVGRHQEVKWLLQVKDLCSDIMNAVGK